MATAEQQVMAEYYDAIADNYDEFHAEMNSQLLQSVIEKVDLQPDDVIADIGSGTGYVAEQLFNLAKLKNPIVCVEPSEKMHEKAKERKGVIPVCKTGEEFFNDVSVHGCFDRVLMLSSDHHFTDRAAIFKGVKNSLRSNGTCAIWIVKNHFCFSLFKEATGLKTYRDRYQETCRILEEENFEVEMSWVDVKFGLKKAKFYRMIRGRFFSNLYGMSDKQIEEGIEKLEQGELGLLNGDDSVENQMSWRVLLAKKLPADNNYND